MGRDLVGLISGDGSFDGDDRDLSRSKDPVKDRAIGIEREWIEQSALTGETSSSSLPSDEAWNSKPDVCCKISQTISNRACLQRIKSLKLQMTRWVRNLHFCGIEGLLTRST